MKVDEFKNAKIQYAVILGGKENKFSSTLLDFWLRLLYSIIKEINRRKANRSLITCIPLIFRASLVAQTVKNLPLNVGDWGLFPGSGRSPGEGNGYPLQYSCLGNTIDRGTWWAMVHGISKNKT